MEFLIYLAPEITLLTLAVILIFADLFVPQNKKEYLGYFSLVGLVGAWLTILPIAQSEVSLWGGSVIVDRMAIFYKELFLIVAILIILLSIRYIKDLSRFQGEYYALVIFCTIGNMLMAASGELISLFVALQLGSIPLAILAAYAKKDPKSNEAGFKYLLLALLSNGILLYGISLIYGTTGTTMLTNISSKLASLVSTSGGVTAALFNQPALALGLVMLVAGFGFKITAVPVHMWVPDVYEGAPTPVTAFLSVGSKAAGFAMVIRVLSGTFGALSIDWPLIWAIIATATMTIGNLSALPQTNIKRLLAYSSIAQAGYIMIGLAGASKMGISSTLLYVFGYVFTNIAAFSVVIIFSKHTKSDQISDYAGLSRRSPVLALSLLIALLSLGGLPLFAGFITKFYVFAAAVQRQLTWLVIVAGLNSVISLYYYLRIAKIAYVDEPTTQEPIPVPPSLAFGLGLAILGIFVIGIYPQPFISITQIAAQSIL